MAETVKIQTIGPRKDIPKKNNPNEHWTSWSLQFENDPQWYDTFWVAPKAPEVGQELAGDKSHHEKFGYKFEIERAGGKGNWNPAAAQATIMLSAVEMVGNFLAMPGHYQMWDTSDVKLKPLFSKYVATVDAAAKQIKEKVVAMGAIGAESKKVETTHGADGDPGPAPPPNIEEFPADQEPVDV